MDDGAPQEELQQQRRVAQKLDIGVNEAGQQQVARESRDAERNAEHGCKQAADDRDLDRVGNAGAKRAGIAVAGGIGEQTLADLEVRLVREKGEARRQPHAVHAVGGVLAQECEEQEHDDEKQALQQWQRPDPGAQPRDRSGPRRARSAMACHGKNHEAAQRNGGE
ncbi:hypothetical protein FQZ97_814180 [compost metagenome]